MFADWRRGVFLLWALLPLSLLAAAPMGRHPLSVEDLWQVQRLGRPAISPDGKWVVVEVTSFSMEENDSTSQLWLLSTDGKTQKQLTHFKGKNSGPAWSPDGKTIAFVSKRSGEVAQVQLLAVDGGEARQLTNLPMPPSGLRWSVDGKTLYCIVQTWPDTPDDESFTKKKKALEQDKVKAFVIDDALFRYWDNWLADGKRPVVFSIDTASGKHANLFAHTRLHLPVTNPAAESYDISPDGKEICFTAESTREPGMDFNLDLYTMSTSKPGEPRNLTRDNPVGDFNPVYSPDGKSIAFSRQTTKFFYADRVRLMVLDRATQKSKEVTASLDRSCSMPQWLGEEGRLLFEAEDQGYHRLYTVDVGSGKVVSLTGQYTYSDTVPATERSGKTTVFLRSTFDFPAQLWKRQQHPERAIFQRLDRFNDDLTKTWKLGEVRNVVYKGADDEDVQMWSVYPPDFHTGDMEGKRKWPLLMMIHGGPHNAIPSDFHFRWNLQLLAAKGYVVACPNFHGSSGFGQKFTDSITGDMASKPFTDIMKATDYMEKQPYIDRERMVAAGASYGGYMMAWLNGHTDRFKAMVCHAGVYNWHSMMASDIVRSRERPLGALPWGDLKQIDKQSPQRFASQFKTPTLVIHGEKDYRVPLTQGLEYYATLRLKGVPARLVYFPDENHWVMRPQNSRLWHLEFFAWLEKYVGHGPKR